MAQVFLYYTALLLFGVSGAAGLWALRDPAPARVRTMRGVTGASIGALILFLVLEATQRGGPPLTGLFHSLLGVTVLLAAAGLVADILFRIPALSLAASLVGFAALIGATTLAPDATPARPDLFENRWIGLHVACMLVAYAAFALGALAGGLYLFTASCLKRKRRLDLVEGLPSLETVDALEARAVGIGFLLLTVGLLVGYLVQRAETARATDWRLDPKVVWTGLTWAAYLVVLVARRLPRLRGRRAAFLAVFGLLFVLFTYFGVRTGFHVYDAPPPPAAPGGP
jgi:ABC-type uncharacterized transport system permease subunit